MARAAGRMTQEGFRKLGCDRVHGRVAVGCMRHTHACAHMHIMTPLQDGSGLAAGAVWAWMGHSVSRDCSRCVDMPARTHLGWERCHARMRVTIK